MRNVALVQVLALLLGIDVTLLMLGVIYLAVLIRRAFSNARLPRVRGKGGAS